MSVSIAIIIPSLNSPLIDQVLAAILAQEQAENICDIIVVGKDEAGLIPATKGIRFIDTGWPIRAAAARNKGIMATTADLLIFLDSDCLPEPRWLIEHIAAHEAGHTAVSGGVLPAGRNYWHLVYNLALFHDLLSTNPSGPRDFLATLNLSIDRSVIETIGLLDETMERGEDVEWTTRMRRAHIQSHFWPQAVVRHEHNRTNFAPVWHDCALSGYYMRRLRLLYGDLLQAPGLLRYPRLIFWFSPLIAAWATWRIFWKRPRVILQFWYTLPALYLTKIAWCWGASHSATSP
jgi:GT2 family glycosyltransferase